MAFKMRGKPVISGTNDHRSALQYKQKADAEYESAVAFNAKLRAAEKAGKLPEEFAKKVRKAGTKDTGSTGSPTNANMMNSPADANYGSPADANMKSPADANMNDSPGNANMKSPADANYGSPADANMEDSPAKAVPLVPIIANAARTVATRYLPVVANVARTQGPKLLRNVTTGLGSFGGSIKSKVFNIAKKTMPYLATYGYGSYVGGEREKTKQKAKENVTNNQPKTGGGKSGGFFGTLKKVAKNMNNKTNAGKNLAKKAKDVITYKKAVKGATTHGDNLNDLIRKRQGLTKGTPEYNAVQNRINRAYGVSKRHGAGLYDAPAADPVTTKGEVKKTKIQTKADKRKGEVDENVARKTTKRAYKTAKKSGTSQEKADAKVKMLEAKLADYEGSKGGKKRVLFGNYLRKRTKRKLDEAKQQAGSPANFGPGSYEKMEKGARKAIQEKLKTKKKKKKADTASTTRSTAGVGKILKSESEKAKMKAAGTGRKN